ncbi:MAG: penicillin-binding protein 2 [Rhodobacteraceae bacterium]|nr:penicillin-binding protein 2 [Paracoccaceae bacterium]
MRRTARDTEESARTITRRGILLGGTMLATSVALGLRMRYMQVDQADQFRLLAEENRINIRLIPPARGQIFDRNGVVIAGNEQVYRIVIVREDARDVPAVIENLRKIVALDDAELERALKEMERRSPFVPVTIAERVSWEAISAVAVNAPALPGITPEVGLSRVYPLGPDFAHVTGYVGPVSDYDLERTDDNDPLLQIPRFQIGKIGVEARLEKLLRGRAGSKRIEVNAAGRVMRELDRQEGEAGADVQLTVDARLQNFVLARLGEESAAVVVMDVATGDLLSITSAPAFDPNLFVRGISVADYKALTENDHRPLADKTVQGAYPPGSTFKMVVALAALEAGLVTADTTFSCRGFLEVSGRRFHCWSRGGHGRVDLHKSLVESCDVYYYELAQRVGIDGISAMAHRLGLGERYDLPLSAVAEGLVPTRAWKRERRGEEWLVGDSLNAAIGQGFVLSTPLQLAVMSARLATGRAVVPRLVKSIDGVEQPRPEFPPLGFSENNLRLIRRAMFSASNDRRGTAYGSRIVEQGRRMAGKTGTSQVRNITAAERARGVFRNEDLPWHRRDHALFVAFAPEDVPQIAVSVVVEHGGGGAAAAAPIARDVVLQALYGGLPPLSAYPESQRARIRAMQEELPLREPAAAARGATRA